LYSPTQIRYALHLVRDKSFFLAQDMSIRLVDVNKLSTLGYLPGGNKTYVDSLRKCLEYVRQDNPTQRLIMKWFQDNFGSQSENVNVSYVRTVKNLALTQEHRSKFSINQLGEQFLNSGDKSIVFRQLDRRFIGISDIVDILSKESLTLDRLCFLLKRKAGTKWETQKQCEIRVNWLQSLGYVVEDGSRYYLAAARDGTARKEQERQRRESKKHQEIKDLIVELGQANGYFTEKEFAVEGCRYDAAWKRLEYPLAPSHVFEIHERGSLDRALRKLKFAYMNGIGELFLIIDSKKKQKAEDLVETTLSEIKSIIKIRTPEDMKGWYEKSIAADEGAKTVGGYRGIMPRMRKKSRSTN